VFSCAFLLFSGLSFAQTGSLAGTVTGEGGAPVEGVMIRIERLDVKGNYRVRTKKKGDYFHAGLPLGTYRVNLEVNGEIVESVNGVRLGMGAPTEVDFDLAEINRRKQAASSGELATEEQVRSMSEAERKAYEEALKSRQQQLSKSKELNEAFNAGMVAKEMGDFDTAVAKLQAAAGLDATQHVVWAQLADAQMSLAQKKTGDEAAQHYTAAVASYDKATELQPNNGAYHYNKGLAYARAGKLEEGKAALVHAAEIDPANSSKYFFNLGVVMENSMNTDAAVDAYRKATEIDPKYADAYYRLGIALTGKISVAEDGVTMIPAPGTVEAFQKYLELSPNGANAEAAKASIEGLTQKVQTTFENK
jgi:tetratricopeptide (TPR) repeat protein